MSEQSQQYVESLKNERRIISVLREKISSEQMVNDSQSSMNNNWAKPAICPNKFDIQLIPVKSAPKPIPVPRYNEISPSSDDIGELDGIIKSEKIIEMVNLPLNVGSIDIPPISSASRPIVPVSYTFPKPSSYIVPKTGYLCIEPKSIDVRHLGDQNCNLGGYFQLYDVSIPREVSFPIPFTVESKSLIFDQSSSGKAYFEIPYQSSSLSLLVVLTKSFSPKLNIKVPFALTLHKLFDEKGSLIPTSKLSNSFFLIGNKPYITQAIDYSIHNSPNVPATNVVFETTVTIENPSFTELSLLWSKKSDGSILSQAFPIDPLFPAPIGTLCGLEITLPKKVKAEHVYFTACLMNPSIPYNQSTNEELICGSKKNDLDVLYQSCALPCSGVMAFPDYIDIFIRDDSIKTYYILIQFYATFAEGPKVIASAVIPIAPLSDRKFGEEICVGLFEPNAIPENAKTTLSPPTKGKMVFKVSLPPLFFPPHCFDQLISCQSIDTLELPSKFKSFGDVVIPQLIPATSRILSFVHPKSISLLVEFWDMYQNNTKEKLRQWIYNIFDPLLIHASFAEEYCRAFTQYINNICTTDDAKTLKLFVSGFQILIDFVNVSVACCDLSSVNEPLYNLLSAIPQLIAHLINKLDFCDANLANNIFSYFVFHHISLFSFSRIENLLYKHLKSLSDIRKNHSNPSAISVLQFSFLSQFAFSKHLIVGLGTSAQISNTHKSYSPYSKLSSQIFLAVFQTLSSGDPHSISLCSGFFSRIVSSIEEIPTEITRLISYALFPLIELLSNHFESQVFMNNSRMQLSLVPTILFILSESTPDLLKQFFHSLSISFQKHFIVFFQTITKVVIDALGVIKPSYDYPQIHMNLLDQITRRFFQFLLIVKDELKHSLDEVASLLRQLLCEYQPSDNFPLFMSFCSEIIQSYSCQRTFSSLFIDLVKSKQHSARVLGTSLLLKQFLKDFMEYQEINLSSIAITDSLTTVLLEGNEQNLIIYTELINQIKSCIDVFGIPELSTKVRERMDSVLVIASTIKNQKESTMPLSERLNQIISLADQNFKFPSMRLKWLREMVRLNEQCGDVISAFICQLHCVVLIATIYENRKPKVVDEKKISRQLTKPPTTHNFIVQPIKVHSTQYNYDVSSVYHEFSFIPSVRVETKVDLSLMDKDAEILLNDFNLSLLLTHLKEAIKLGEEASMYYTLRPLSSMMLRLHYQSRNYASSAEICNNLSNYFSYFSTSYSLGVDVPLLFYLCEIRTNSMNPIRKVYCFRKADQSSIIEQLKSREHLPNLPISICHCHSSQCAGEGICIVPLEAIKCDEDDESLHCWSSFRSLVPVVAMEGMNSEDYNTKKFARYNIKTQEPLPFFHMGVDVKKFEEETLSMSDVITRLTKKWIKNFGKLREDMLPYFEMPIDTYRDNPDDLFGNDLHRFRETISACLSSQNNLFEYLKRVLPLKTDFAKEKAGELYGAITEALLLYQRGLKELKSESLITEHASHQNTIMKLVNEFSSAFDLPKHDTNTYYIGSIDPMSVHYDFE